MTIIEQGLIFSVLAMGVHITYKLLDIPDLSVEGTFPFGAFIYAYFVIAGVNAWLSLFLAFIFGNLGGFITALIFIKLRIKPLLGGILTAAIFYSVNLKILGKSNVSLSKLPRLYDLRLTSNAYLDKIILLFFIVLIIKVLLDIFFKTEIGYLIKTTGDNETLVKSLGANSNIYKTLGLMISNGLVAMSGALMAQSQTFADNKMGQSIIVVALASIIIGDTILKNKENMSGTLRAVIGAIIYKIIGGVAIDLGMEAQDLSMINTFIVIIFILYNNAASSYNKRRKGRKQDA